MVGVGCSPLLASLLPGLCSACAAASTRPGPGGTRVRLSMRSAASQPQRFREESGALAGEAAVRSRSSRGRLRVEPLPDSATHLPPAPPMLGALESGDHSGEGATRTRRMDARTWRLGWRCLLLLALLGSTRSEGVESCEEVRKVFQWRLGGAVKGLPEAPRAGKSRWLARHCAVLQPRTSGLGDHRLRDIQRWSLVRRRPFWFSGPSR